MQRMLHVDCMPRRLGTPCPPGRETGEGGPAGVSGARASRIWAAKGSVVEGLGVGLLRVHIPSLEFVGELRKVSSRGVG